MFEVASAYGRLYLAKTNLSFAEFGLLPIAEPEPVKQIMR